MKFLRRLYYRLVPTYKRVDFIICTWDQGDELIKKNPEWQIAEEDKNYMYPMVALEITKRITE